MKIAFILPNTTNRAMGGYKVVYQYANYMAVHGNNVTIIYDNEQMVNGHHVIFTPALKMRANYYLQTEPKWFELHTSIQKKNTFYLSREELSDYDLIVATAKITADYLYREKINPERVIYLIQDFENWGCSDEEVYRSYNYGYKNIAISKQLLQIVEKATGKECFYLPDGIDTDCFKVINPLKSRARHSLAMMYRNSLRKGYQDGLKVFQQLKNRYPDLKGYMFGVDRRPKEFPDWINFEYRADQKKLTEIYNQVRVFLSPSLQEGYGLTGLESMACGCALVSTDTQGVHEYAENNITASIVPVSDVNGMVKKITELFENERLLEQRSKAGQQHATELSVDKMGERFRKMVDEFVGK